MLFVRETAWCVQLGVISQSAAKRHFAKISRKAEFFFQILVLFGKFNFGSHFGQRTFFGGGTFFGGRPPKGIPHSMNFPDTAKNLKKKNFFF